MPWRVLLVALVVAGPAVPGPGQPGAAAPAVVEVYPDPVADGDRGEFVAVRVPPGTNLSTLRISDGEGSARPPPVVAGGTVLLSTDPEAVRALTDRRVVALRGHLRLANGGDEVRLSRDGERVDAMAYRDAEEGERLVREAGDWEWRPLGLRDRAPVRATARNATVFALPDRPDAPLAAVRAADERVLFAGYTLSSRRVGRALRAAADRGVTVRVLVDGGPVGGLTRREAGVLDNLTAAGVGVTVLAGERARFAFHHAKYAVADDRVVVLTENWKPAGTGGHSSRGWGVVLDSPALAADVVALFRSDAGWRDGVPWESFRRNRTFEPARPANDTFPSRFGRRRVAVDSVRLLTAPGNAEPALLSLLGRAEESVLVEQVSIGSRRQPFVRATLAAARRGVRVRVVLSRAWYVREDNRALVEWLNERAGEEGLALEARLARPRSRFEKVHAKGVVVDGEHVVVGSLNWNNHSARENREVAVVVESEAAARYFERVVRADIRGGAWRLPVGLAVVVALGALVAGRVGRRMLHVESVAGVVPAGEWSDGRW